MSISKLAFISGAILGGIGVITGAMGAHALEDILNSEQLASYETAVRYQMFHALLLILLGIISSTGTSTSLTVSIISAILGVVLFSGSIYLLVLSDIPVGIVTPIGGLCLVTCWVAFLFWAISRSSKSK